jgi:CSLREA domain-containing protein
MTNSYLNSISSHASTELATLSSTLSSTLQPTPQWLSDSGLQDPLNQAVSASSSPMVSSGSSTALNPFVVTSTADAIDPNDGVTTLREAINAANAKPGADTIRFSLGSGAMPV